MNVFPAAGRGVVVQGITGRAAGRHAMLMREYGTSIVAGVSPTAEPSQAGDVPVFRRVADAVAATNAKCSIAFVPPDHVASALVEAAESGIELAVSVTEGVNLHDTMRAVDAARANGMRILGPNSPGFLLPWDEVLVGILPTLFVRRGYCAVLTRSGTLSYEVVQALHRVGLGISAWIGVGGDPVKGSTFAELVPALLEHPETGALVLIGEIGGVDEEDAIDALGSTRMPVFALIAGRHAPVGISMGHAGAIVEGGRGGYDAKRKILESSGVALATRPSEIARFVLQSERAERSGDADAASARTRR